MGFMDTPDKEGEGDHNLDPNLSDDAPENIEKASIIGGKKTTTKKTLSDDFRLLVP